MSNTNAKVTLTTSQLKERLDKMLLIEEARDKEFAAYTESEREHRKGEQEKINKLLAYLETKEWRAKLESLRYKEVYVHPSPLGTLFGYKGKWVKEVIPSYEYLAEVILYLQGVADEGLLVEDRYGHKELNVGKTKVWVDAYIGEGAPQLTPYLSTTERIGYLNPPPTHSAPLPINKLRYMVSLATDIEVDVEWLQKIDGIDK